MKKILAVASFTGAVVFGATACSGSAVTSGAVTSTSYMPPTTQTVDVSCAWWSKGWCYSWNTMQLPVPQDCTINLKNPQGQTGAVHASVDQGTCGSYKGKHWPLG